MKYWIRTCAPLVYRAAWIETTCELINWIEEVLNESWKISRKEGYSLIPETPKGEKPFNILERCFVLRKVSDTCWEKILQGDYYNILKKRKTFPYIKKELDRVQKYNPAKRGRKKKIILKNMEEINAVKSSS